MNKDSVDAGKCIHCGKCTRNCSFLSKYNIDIGAAEKLRELAYHCFLCGKCSEICPVGIDGKGIVLKMRQEMVLQAGKIPEKGYGMLLAEKKNYLFRNYRHVNCGKKASKDTSGVDIAAAAVSVNKKSILFPGCNFPSFYPETTKKLISALEEHGIGVAFDCCGKPVAELGMKEQEEKIINEIETRLKEAGIEEVIMACPNCYHFLKPRLKNVSIISVYEKLQQLGIGKIIESDISVFLPCPDRKEKELLEKIEPFLAGEMKVITESTCCGLGGCAAGKEPELAKGMAENLRQAGYEEIHTYCGSCSGNLTRNGCGTVTHILAEILETNENPDTSGSFMNRIKTKFY